MAARLLVPFATGILVKTRTEDNANGVIGSFKAAPLWIALFNDQLGESGRLRIRPWKTGPKTTNVISSLSPM